jgi:ABC-2 type transport system permease protein
LFIALLLASYLQLLVRSVVIYFSSTFRQAEFLATTSQTFRDFLGVQSIFVFFVAVALSGAIADDRRANALQLYLSKPLTRVEYVGGKLVASSIFLLGVTFAPAILLLMVQMVLSGSAAFLRQNLFLVPAIILFSGVEVLLAAFGLLALSSLSKSRRFVAVMYAGCVFFTLVMSQALRAITGSRVWAVISPSSVLAVIGDAIFRVRSQPPIPVFVAVLTVLVLIGASLWILERRVRGVEVIV